MESESVQAILNLASMLKDFPRLQAAAYILKVIMSPTWCDLMDY